MKPYLMIVDDAVDQLHLLKHVINLIAPAVEVITAQSGDEALHLLRNNPDRRPKVILLDIRMPGKNGTEVLKELKADQLFKRIPVCMFSNGDVDREVCVSYENGASIYFRKPTGIDEMKSFVGHFKDIWFKFASFCPH